MKKLLLMANAIILSMTTNAQDVNIPDVNFKAYLVGNSAINTNADSEIQVSEANAFTGTIDCPSMAISDLTGIEEFTSLTELFCYSNNLTSLDLSNNSALTYVRVELNQLTSLNLTGCTQLDDLRCEHNEIANLDVSGSPLLATLLCNHNMMTSLDLSNNPALTFVFCHSNIVLSSMNLANGNNTAITNFNASGNMSLNCITVDDATYSTTNWTNIDAGTSFSEDCTASLYNNEMTQMHIYPNPGSNQIEIKSDSQVERVLIFDVTGNLVMSSDDASLTVANLASGTYTFSIQTEKGIVQKRFVKM